MGLLQQLITDSLLSDAREIDEFMAEYGPLEKALFSEYKGVSPSGAVTIWVDMMGKLVRVHLAPNTLYEGGEPWLTKEILAAHEAAKRAAEVLDFSMADLVQELDGAPQLKQCVSPEAQAPRAKPSSVGIAQIISTYQWCGYDAARQLGTGEAAAELRLGSQPVVLCRSGSWTLELPIAPAMVTLVFAALGMAISLFTVIGTVRRTRAAQRS
ncbi:MAG: hypothetical protein ACRDTG_16335 [Pseudonocardiaceae bacterium]